MRGSRRRRRRRRSSSSRSKSSRGKGKGDQILYRRNQRDERVTHNVKRKTMPQGEVDDTTERYNLSHSTRRSYNVEMEEEEEKVEKGSTRRRRRRRRRR